MPAVGVSSTNGPPAAPHAEPKLAPPASVVPAVPTPLPQPPGATSLVSMNVAKGFPNGASAYPAISSTGRYVAFASAAQDLVPGGSAGATAVYVRDRAKGTTVRLPLPGGADVPQGGYAFEPSISADGSVVAFTYRTSQDPASPSSVEVWSRSTGQTVTVSNPPPGTPDSSGEPSVSGNGNYVAFSSRAQNIVPNVTTDFALVYRYDVLHSATALVSASPSGRQAAGDSTAPSISGDGSLVAFTSAGGSSLLGQDPGTGTQVFVRDMGSGAVQEVSLGPNGELPQADSGQASISDNGQFVAFTSSAANFVGGQGSGTSQVYRRDVNAGQTVLVSVKDDGTPVSSSSGQPGISRDGRMVAYVVVGGISTKALLDRQTSAILLRDVTAQQTALISVARTGDASASINRMPHVAGGGRFVVFASNGADLVAGDDNKLIDVFIRDLPPVPTLKPPTIDFGTRAVAVAAATAAGVMTNAGWGPLTTQPATIGGANAGDFSVLADGCKGVSLYRGDACTVTVGFAPTAPGARTGQLQVPDNAPGSPHSARLTGIGSQARIVLDPPVGPQGIVVVATGSGFPAGAQIQLTWSPGMTPTLPVVTADDKGGFSIQVLVFRHDVVGVRNLVAKWVGGPEFPTLQVPMLITVRSVAPPTFGGLPMVPFTLLFRG